MVRKPYARWIFSRRWNRGGERAQSVYAPGVRAANRDPDYVYKHSGRRYRFKGQQGRRSGSAWFSGGPGLSEDAFSSRFSPPGRVTRRVSRARRMRVSQPWWERLWH